MKNRSKKTGGKATADVASNGSAVAHSAPNAAPAPSFASNSHTVASRMPLDYSEVVYQVREMVEQHVPRGETVAVVSKGDPELIVFAGRRGMHMPRTAEGAWAGFNPADATDAVAFLEEARSAGARYFLLPAPSDWWLKFYPGFKNHLERSYRLVASDDAGMLFDLSATSENHIQQVSTRVDFLMSVLLSLHQSLKRPAAPDPQALEVAAELAAQQAEEKQAAEALAQALQAAVEDRLCALEDLLQQRSDVQEHHAEHLNALTLDMQQTTARLPEIEEKLAVFSLDLLEEKLREQEEILSAAFERRLEQQKQEYDRDLQAQHEAMLAMMDEQKQAFELQLADLGNHQEQQSSALQEQVGLRLEDISKRQEQLGEGLKAQEQAFELRLADLSNNLGQLGEGVKAQEQAFELQLADLSKDLGQLGEGMEAQEKAFDVQLNDLSKNLGQLGEGMKAQEQAFELQLAGLSKDLGQLGEGMEAQEKAFDVQLNDLSKNLGQLGEGMKAQEQAFELQLAEIKTQQENLSADLKALQAIVSTDRQNDLVDQRIDRTDTDLQRRCSTIADELRDGLAKRDQRLDQTEAQLASITEHQRRHQTDCTVSFASIESKLQEADQKLARQDSKMDALTDDARLARMGDSWLKELLRITTALGERVVLQEERLARLAAHAGTLAEKH
jgi:hypothetical protein